MCSGYFHGIDKIPGRPHSIAKTPIQGTQEIEHYDLHERGIAFAVVALHRLILHCILWRSWYFADFNVFTTSGYICRLRCAALHQSNFLSPYTDFDTSTLPKPSTNLMCSLFPKFNICTQHCIIKIFDMYTKWRADVYHDTDKETVFNVVIMSDT